MYMFVNWINSFPSYMDTIPWSYNPRGYNFLCDTKCETPLDYLKEPVRFLDKLDLYHIRESTCHWMAHISRINQPEGVILLFLVVFWQSSL